MKVSPIFRTEAELSYTAHLLGIATLLAKLRTGALMAAEAVQVEEDVRLRLTQLANFKYDEVIDEAVHPLARVEDVIAISYLQGFQFDAFVNALVDAEPLKEMVPETRQLIGKFFNRTVLPPFSVQLLLDKGWKTADKWYFFACFKPEGGFPLNVEPDIAATLHPEGRALLFA